MTTTPTIRSVLCVDDNELFAHNLRDLIRTTGRAAEAVHQGRRAVQAAAERHRLGRPFDVVLLDLRLPGEDGVEVLRQVLANSPGVCVILLTGYGSVTAAVESMAAGAVGMIEKKYPFVELMKLVETMHARHADKLRLQDVERAAERERAEREKAEARLELITDLTAILNHNLKNALSPLDNCFYELTKLSEGLSDADRSRAREELVIGEHCCRRMEYMLKRMSHLLDFPQFVPQSVSLSRAVRHGVRAARTFTPQADKVATVELEPDLPDDPLWVSGDDDLLAAAIGFLVQNALDELIARADRRQWVGVTARRVGERVLLTVADTGPGLSDVLLDWLRAEAVRRTPFPKSARNPAKVGVQFGVGLQTAARVVRACGGTLRGTNRLDADGRTVVGAEFTIDLPSLPPPGDSP